jgi:hypothetical protein
MPTPKAEAMLPAISWLEGYRSSATLKAPPTASSDPATWTVARRRSSMWTSRCSMGSAGTGTVRAPAKASMATSRMALASSFTLPGP